MLRKLLAELLGTFALVFAGTGAIVVNALTSGAVTHQGIALTFGLIVMAMIYALGDVSGAHFNPAVTTGFFLASRLPLRTALLYIAAQLAGALLASTTLLLLFGNIASLGATIPLYSPAQSFALETILTAILMFVILSVSSGSRESGTTAALAIGGIIALEALFAGPISGASMNPARSHAPPRLYGNLRALSVCSLAPALLSGNLRALWVYLLAPTLGAALAVPLWRATRHPNPAPIH